MSFIPKKDYLEKCVLFFYNKDLIVDNKVMDREAGRTIFKEEFVKIHGSHHNFTGVLKGWEQLKFVQYYRDKSKVYFKEEVVKAIINKGKKEDSKKKKRQRKSNKSLTACSVCDTKFTSPKGFNDHVTNSKQHHFRVLYINKSKLLKSKFKDVIFEFNANMGSGPEVFSFRKDVQIQTVLIIRNVSNDTYSVEGITKLHMQTCPIRIRKCVLPFEVPPQSRVSLEVEGVFKNSDSQMFVHVFTVKNLRNNILHNILKEVIVHINSDEFDELLPTVPFSKGKRVQNDIETNCFIGAEESGSSTFKGTVPLKSYKVPNQLKRIINADLKPYDGMTLEEQNYLRRILKTLKVSNLKNCLSKKNYCDLLQLLLFMEEHQMCKDIRNYDMVNQEIMQLKGKCLYELKVPGLAEHRPSLLPGDSIFVKDKSGKQAYQGIVKETKESSVVLRFNKKFTDVYIKNRLFSVTYDYNRCNIRAEHRSVELVHEHKAVSHFFPKHTGGKHLKKYNVVWFNDKITNNPEQQQAVLHILSETSYPAPYLIFGPPGTGKTMTIIEAISQVWKLKPNSKMLVCAPSNSVANEIACRLIEYIPPSDLFRYLSLSFYVRDVPDKIKSCINYDDGDFFHPTFHELLDYRIIITTLANASRIVSFGVPEKHFSYVFIDESGHATETETLIPIGGVLTAKNIKGALHGQVVLAGDPQQLGPVIHSGLAKQYGFGISMLERMMTTLKLYKRNEQGKYNPRALTKLVYNYRSHPAILKVPNKLFYENELVPKADDLVQIAVNWKHLPNPNIPIIFHSVIGTDRREDNSPSYFNIQEVEVVIYYLNLLIGRYLKGTLIRDEHIGIIAPYRKQVQKLRQACERRKWNDVTIGSVEQFQGQEKLIIITTTVRSQPKLLKFDSKFHLGFLNNPKRFNVAVTRAKALLIVVGNPNLLQHEKYWKEFIKYCQDNNCFTGSPFDLPTKLGDNMLNILKMAKLHINDVSDDVSNFARGNV